MTVKLLIGDVRQRLAELPAASVHCCVTSPPYLWLRSYGTEPQVWGEPAGGCPGHDWGDPEPGDRRGGSGPGAKEASAGDGMSTYGRGVGRGQWCQTSGCWLGELGLEPTVDCEQRSRPGLAKFFRPATGCGSCYVCHLVEVFRVVRRVLRADGTLVLNLGDSYAGSGKGPSQSLQPEASQIGPSAQREHLQAIGPQEHTIGNGRVSGYKPKDLMEIPSRVVLALQQDGWYLRSRIPWLKQNAMPESARDRPGTSVEYLFLLAKSRTYYWDPDAIRMTAGGNTHARGYGDGGPKAIEKSASLGMHDGWAAATREVLSQRNRRNGDWFFESWQGLLLDETGDPLALVINPQPLKAAHYAAFPPKLVEPFVRAGTSERGCCPSCGAPWRRVVERTATVFNAKQGVAQALRNAGASSGGASEHRVATNLSLRRWRAPPGGRPGPISRLRNNCHRG